MRRWFIVLVLLLVSLLTGGRVWAWPKPAGLVNDYAQVLDKNTGDRIEDYLRRIRDTPGPRKGLEIAVVLVPNLEGKTPKDYAVGLGTAWAVGTDKGGVVILVAMAERQIRVQPNATASAWLSAVECDFIYNQIIKPLARQKRWGEALMGAAQRLEQDAEGQALTYIPEEKVAHLDDSVKITVGGHTESPPDLHQKGSSWTWVFWGLVFLGILYILSDLPAGESPSDMNSFRKAGVLLQEEIRRLSGKKRRRLTPSQRLRRQESLAKKRKKRLARIEKNKLIRAAEKKARKVAKRLRKSVHRELKRLAKTDPKAHKKALKILHRWARADRNDRRWCALRVPSMSQHIYYTRSDSGFGITDFLFWHWMLFPSHSYSESSGFTSSVAPSSQDSSYASSSSSWSSPSYGSSDSGSSFSGGGGFSAGGDSGGGGSF